MKKILRVSPGVLFGITIALMIIPSLDNEYGKHKIGFGVVATLLLSLIVVSWYYSIGSLLQNRHTVKRGRFFKFNSIALVTLMPILYLIVFVDKATVQNYLGIFILVSIYLFFAFFQVLTYCAKLLAMESRMKAPVFSEYFQYILLLWMFPVGIWFVQPIMNRLSS